MHISLKKQQGASLTGIMFNLVLGVVLLLFALRVIPLYMDDYYLKDIVAGLPEKVGEKPRLRDVKDTIDKQLSINNMKIPKELLEVKRFGNTITVVWPYQRKVSFVSNIELLLSFQHEIAF